MKKLLLAVAVALPALLSGCAAGLMRDASSQQISPPNPERAKAVFMRSSMVAGAIGCDLFEVVNGELRFIGQLPTGNKVAFEETLDAALDEIFGGDSGADTGEEVTPTPNPTDPTCQTSSANTGSNVWCGIAKMIGTVAKSSSPMSSSELRM